jgi:hypothetical protein
LELSKRTIIKGNDHYLAGTRIFLARIFASSFCKRSGWLAVNDNWILLFILEKPPAAKSHKEMVNFLGLNLSAMR